MAETSTNVSPLKRHREKETIVEEQEEESKRQKLSSSSYNKILCLLNDSEEHDEHNNDLTSFINALQQEISFDDKNTVVSGLSNVVEDSSSCDSSKEDEVDDYNKEKMMQHLLEASDDELGIPNTQFGGSNYENINQDYVKYENINQDYVSMLDGFGDAFWEFEDEAANYYTLLQSELFM